MCAQPAEVLLDAFFERKHQLGETISKYAKALKELLTQAEPTLPAASSITTACKISSTTYANANKFQFRYAVERAFGQSRQTKCTAIEMGFTGST